MMHPQFEIGYFNFLFEIMQSHVISLDEGCPVFYFPNEEGLHLSHNIWMIKIRGRSFDNQGGGMYFGLG